MQAEKLILLTDVEGIKDENGEIIYETTKEEIYDMINNGVINGGMIPKVECCVEAIHKGVKNVVIMDGRVPHSILMELLTDEGAGTLFKEK